MLYTIVPWELIQGLKSAKKKRSTDFMTINGVLLEGERNGDYFKIHRVISSDPSSYMNKNIYPGSVIKK